MNRIGSLIPRSPVLYATVLFFLVIAIVEPRNFQPASLSSMLPFAALLTIVSLGQTLVVQQRGIDLSVAGTMTLSAIIVSKVAGGDEGALPFAVLAALAAGAVIGAVLGLVVVVLRVTPLIATFGMNAVVTGLVVAYAGGSSTAVPLSLSGFASARTLGVHNLVWIALICTVLAVVVMSGTAFGRRFEAVGASHAAARASGERVQAIRWSAYLISSTLYALAGVLAAGFVNVPDLSVGASYVMPSIAAVVLGGTSFAGGRGRMIGTMVAALLLTQLNHFVLSIGASTAVQLIVQAAVIAVAAAQAPVAAAIARRVSSRRRTAADAAASASRERPPEEPREEPRQEPTQESLEQRSAP